MKPSQYVDKYFGMYCTRINDLVGACSGGGIQFIPDKDLETLRFIEITEEEFDIEELSYEQIKGRPMLRLYDREPILKEE